MFKCLDDFALLKLKNLPVRKDCDQNRDFLGLVNQMSNYKRGEKMGKVNIKELQKQIKKFLVDGPAAAETKCHKTLKRLISFPH